MFFSSINGSAITLENNEMKDIMKVIKSLENRGTLLKETTRKITNHEEGFLNFLRTLITAGLPLIKSVLTSVAKSVLLPLNLSTGMSAADAAIQRKIYGSRTTVHEEMEDIMKIVKLLEESGLLVKGTSETIKNETKQQKRRFLPMTLAFSLLGGALTGKEVIRVGEHF